ncbi:MAG: hypothetical protein H0U75_11975 [Legionella sp.]|nr:hypothetical protein [Legionella sp.]
MLGLYFANWLKEQYKPSPTTTTFGMIIEGEEPTADRQVNRQTPAVSRGAFFSSDCQLTDDEGKAPFCAIDWEEAKLAPYPF